MKKDHNSKDISRATVDSMGERRHKNRHQKESPQGDGVYKQQQPWMEQEDSENSGEHYTEESSRCQTPHPRHPKNHLNKYADDCYLIVPSVNSHFVQEELDHVAEWDDVNNLKLNSTKSKEMIIRRPKTKLADLPLPISEIERVDSMNILGVTLRFDLSFHEHVEGLVRKSAQTMYALRLLRSQGLHGRYLWDFTGAVLVSRLSYASQAWWGLINEGEKNQLGAIIAKAVQQGFLAPDQPTFQEICDSADVSLFRFVSQNPDHVLHQLLPPFKHQNYNLRERAHNLEIPFTKSVIFRKTFIMKMLYLESY